LLKRFGSKKRLSLAFPCAGESQSSGSKARVARDLRAKDAAEIICVYENRRRVLEFLEGLRAASSTAVEVLNREYDETMTLRAGEKRCTLEACHEPDLVPAA